jgi:peptidoglycan L-alanyl-D-glutamate endopeptidase CwlK
MIESISLQRINTLHPKVRQEVINTIELVNAKLTKHSQVRIVQATRDFEYQNHLYALGRTEKNQGFSPKKPFGNIVTKAKGGQSYHNYGLAFDFCLLIEGKEISWNTVKDYDGDGQADWLEVVLEFTKIGWKWGKAFDDLPHLEKTFGLDYKEMLKRYNAGDFIAGTKFIRI